MLNALETVEMVEGFQRNAAPPAPISLCDSPVNAGESTITQDLKHPLHHQEDSAEDVLPEASEEVQPAKDFAGALRHRHLHQRIIRFNSSVLLHMTPLIIHFKCTLLNVGEMQNA